MPDKKIINQERLEKRAKARDKLMKRKRVARRIESNIRRRHNAEKRFRFYGIGALSVAFIFLFILFYNIIDNGKTAFIKTEIKLNLYFDKNLVETKDFEKILRNSLLNLFPMAENRADKKSLYNLLSSKAADDIEKLLTKNPDLIDKNHEVWLLASSDTDMFFKGKIKADLQESRRKINNKQLVWLQHLENDGNIRSSFNKEFFTSGDSRSPEQAGILSSLVGSFYLVIICLVIALPIGVMTAIYLEEFAPRNKITEIIEVNINNLAAVPSVVFGLLGLSLYIQFLGMPRSASLVGGLTLALLALPVIVIASRAAIRSVPKTIREAALALGATKLQVITHHILPLSLPGIMTGTILSIARILGETAPLLMIGMVAFIADIPQNITSPSSALPVQIYLWADSPELGFAEKTSAAIIILLLFLILVNSLAIYLRRKFEVRW